jgi:hypothetical protein
MKEFLLSVRDESLLSLQKHPFQSKFGIHVSTAPEQHGDHATPSNPHSGHRSYYPSAHQHWVGELTDLHFEQDCSNSVRSPIWMRRCQLAVIV